MIKKCLNCSKWITCQESNPDKVNCINFKFKRIEVKYVRGKKQITNDKSQKCRPGVKGYWFNNI